MRAIIASLLCLAAIGVADAQERARATFAGGCFWCMEPPFDKLDGVVSTTSGYTGGRTADPKYEQVSAGRTGHAEVVEVLYDPRKVTYSQLLDVFWRNIDPLTANAQFCDVGSQYRAAIFVHDETQRRLGRIQDRGGAPPAEAGRDRGRDGFEVLARGGLPPGLLQEEPDPIQPLPRRPRTRPATGGDLGAGLEGPRRGPVSVWETGMRRSRTLTRRP